jgi:hypothetical protein
VNVSRDPSWICVPALFAVVAILSGALMSHAAMAQEEKAVENFPTVLRRVGGWALRCCRDRDSTPVSNSGGVPASAPIDANVQGDSDDLNHAPFRHG